MQAVSKVFNVTEAVLFVVPWGREQDYPVRRAVYITRKSAARSLSQITEVFDFAYYGSASGTICSIATQIKQDKSLVEIVKQFE